MVIHAGVHRPPTETCWYHHHSQGLVSEHLHSWLDSLGEKAPLFLVALMKENVKYFSLAVLWHCVLSLWCSFLLSTSQTSPFTSPCQLLAKHSAPSSLSSEWLLVTVPSKQHLCGVMFLLEIVQAVEWNNAEKDLSRLLAAMCMGYHDGTSNGKHTPEMPWSWTCLMQCWEVPTPVLPGMLWRRDLVLSVPFCLGQSWVAAAPSPGAVGGKSQPETLGMNVGSFPPAWKWRVTLWAAGNCCVFYKTRAFPGALESALGY